MTTRNQATFASPETAPAAADEGGSKRNLKGIWNTVAELLGVGFSLFYIYTSGFGVVSVCSHRAVFIAATLALSFLYYPFSKRRSPKDRPSVIDLLFAGLSLAFAAYFICQYPTMADRIGLPPTTLDMVFGLVAILMCLEGARRVLGPSLPIIAIVFILYSLFGYLVPGALGHAGQSLSRIVSYQFNTLEGIFGVVASVCATYVLIFVLLGAFLEKSGVGDFFIQLALSLTGRSIGGPAKAAVVASGLFGSISGSAVANTVATGAFTIPLMKRAGYKPEVAGAIEPAASTGGQFMPPVMGAGAFIMSELTGIPYVKIVLAALAPAIVYFVGVYIMVHLEAKRTGIRGLTSNEIPRLGTVLKRGWFLSTPILVVIVLMLRGFSPQYAGFWALVSAVVVNLFHKEKRMSLGDLYEALVLGSKNALVIGATAGVIGLVVGSIFLTGLGTSFSEFVISLSHGILPLAILLIGLASYVLGMGMTVTSSYIVLAVLAVPALLELKVAMLAAHFIVFWFSQDANLTPPVCVAAFAGASIADAPPFKTGWNSLKFGSVMYLMPFMFVYAPGLLLVGRPLAIAATIASCLLAMLPYGACIQGFLVRKTTLVERILLLMSSLCLLKPGLVTDALGIGLLVGVWAAQRFTGPRTPALAGQVT